MATLTIDWTRCEGHGVCLAAFGERLHADRWGFPQGVSTRGTEVADHERGAARTAVATCPAAALRLVLG